MSPPLRGPLDILAFHWAGLVKLHPDCGAINDASCGRDCVKGSPLGGKVFQVTKPRFVQWTIFVTCDGAWTAIQSFEHEKPPGREGSAPAPSFVQSELGLFFCNDDGTRDLPERGFERYRLFSSVDRYNR